VHGAARGGRHGLPSSDPSGGIPNACLKERTGFLVPERDEDALARRMAELLEDPVRRTDGRRQAVRWSRIDSTLTGKPQLARELL